MSKDGKAKIAVLGAGWWGVEVYIPALLDNPDVDLVAVNRRNRDALDQITKRFGIAKGYTDYRDLLATEDLDGVVVVSPHTVHFEQAMAALDAGAHVLVDKPMTTNAAEARTLVSHAKAKDRQILVSYGWNFTDFARKAADLVAEGGVATGGVGEIRHVVCHMATPTGDLFGGEGLAETADHMFQPMASTWSDPQNAGGYGWGQLVHALGLMFRLADIAPTEVYGIGGTSATGVDLFNAATVKFANGATAALSGAATLAKDCPFQVDIRIFGTEGMLLVDVERERVELRRYDGNHTVLPLEPGAGAYHCVEPTARLAEICLGKPVVNDAPGIVGQRAIEVLDAMYRSFASGAPERV